LFCFRKIGELDVRPDGLSCKMNGLRFAEGLAAIRTSDSAAIGPDYGWHHQSVKKQDGCGKDE
jgi:hypothetical protein